MEKHFNGPEPMALMLSGVMTFLLWRNLFSVSYQRHNAAQGGGSSVRNVQLGAFDGIAPHSPTAAR